MKFGEYFMIGLMIYLILWLVWWVRLDNLDRTVITQSLTTKGPINILALQFQGALGLEKQTFYRFAEVGAYILLLPFLPANALAKVTEGVMYSLYDASRNEDLVEKSLDKLDWEKVFNKCNIKTPKIYAYSEQGRVIILEPNPPAEKLIVKPRKGMLGLGVQALSWPESIRLLSNQDDLIIQERIEDCSGLVRHYRVVTQSDGTIFTTIEMSNDKGEVSNYGAGGKVIICENGSCIDNIMVKKELDEITSSLLQMHINSEYSKAFTVGWDVMIDCKNGIPVAYCLEGNVPNASWLWPDLCPDNMIARYKESFKRTL